MVLQPAGAAASSLGIEFMVGARNDSPVDAPARPTLPTPRPMPDSQLATLPYALSQMHDLAHVAWPDRYTMSLQTLLPMWQDVLGFCDGRRLRRVLVEGHAPTRDMRPIDAFQHGAHLARIEAPGLRVAFCLYDFEPDVVTWLFARTANEGSCTVEFFRELPASLRWVGM